VIKRVARLDKIPKKKRCNDPLSALQNHVIALLQRIKDHGTVMFTKGVYALGEKYHKH